MIKVMFVCYGNICRSTMAEFLLKHMVKDLDEEFIIKSSGTSTEELGNDTYYLTKQTLDLHDIPYSKRKATQFKRSDYDNYDYIICMDKSNVRAVNRVVNDIDNKVKLLMEYAGQNRDVADPWYTRDFETTYNDINLALNHFVKQLGF